MDFGHMLRSNSYYYLLITVNKMGITSPVIIFLFCWIYTLVLLSFFFFYASNFSLSGESGKDIISTVLYKIWNSSWNDEYDNRLDKLAVFLAATLLRTDHSPY